MNKKYPYLFFSAFLIAMIPFSFLFFGAYVNFDTMSAIMFLFVVLVLVARYRKRLDFQVILKLINIPIIYIVLWRTKLGLKFMDRFASKHREPVKLAGYCFIGLGFVGMIFISVNILYMLFKLFVAPKETAQGISLVLPLTNIPGVGYLSFWHFLITVFITMLIHEFAHGIVARAHNVSVKSSGLGLFSILIPIFPLAFVEPDEKKLVKEKDIVQYSIFAAGPMVNIIFAFLVLLIMNFAFIPLENGLTHPIGISFSSVMDEYPAKEAGMEPGIIINEVNGVEVLDYGALSKQLRHVGPGEELILGTSDGVFTLITKASPDDPDVGYIGILGVANERRIKEEYSLYGGTFFWLKGLIKWMFIINLMIGLMNLLPLLVTDGGRMLKIALERIFGEGKAAKVWMFIGWIFIGTILYAFLIRYGTGLLNLLGFA